MKRMSFLFICSSLLFIHLNNNAKCGITYKLNGGRFGDNLLSYSKAKWLSYIHGIPFYYHDFPYCDQLQLSVLENKCTQNIANQHKKIVLPNYQKPFIDPDRDCLYINQWYTKSDLDWNNVEFIAELKKMIAPLYELELITPPVDFLSVALHIRTGGSYVPDVPEVARCPLRFVPVEFYIEQLRRLYDECEDKKIYVYIFTDHTHPEQLVQQCIDALSDCDITFEYRQAGNSHKSNVLEDFFSMMRFDYLIRPGSHFSRFVERLGDNKVVIFPSHVYKISNNEHVIDEVTIKMRKDSTSKWKKQVIHVS